MADDEQLIERVRGAIDAFNRGDFAAAVLGAHPGIVFVRPGGQSEMRGKQALRAWMEPDAFESQSSELLSFETKGNRILTHQRTNARGPGSGIEMEIDSWVVWTFDEDGKVTRMELYLRHEEDEARRALRPP